LIGPKAISELKHSVVTFKVEFLLFECREIGKVLMKINRSVNSWKYGKQVRNQLKNLRAEFLGGSVFG
jgi:hypothetical protein